VAAKWYFPEPGHEAASGILTRGISGEHELLAPDLIVPEFVNVLWKHVRRRECSIPEAEAILELWEADRPALVPSADLATKAFQLATALDQSLYDCLYLALAIGIDARLVTADRKLARVAHSVSAQVELIG
jgi:predicted nucleic acid-binding protein